MAQPRAGPRAESREPLPADQHDARAHNPIELRILPIQIRVPAAQQRLLLSAAHAAAGVLAVAVVEPVDDVHARDDAADRHEAVGVEAAVSARLM